MQGGSLELPLAGRCKGRRASVWSLAIGGCAGADLRLSRFLTQLLLSTLTTASQLKEVCVRFKRNKSRN